MALFVLGFVSIWIDIHQQAEHGKPYFFDPEKIDSYEEPIFTGIEEEMRAHYQSKKAEFSQLKRYLNFMLSDQKNLSIGIRENNQISISGAHKSGYLMKSPLEYKTPEGKEILLKFGLSPETIEGIEKNLKPLECKAIKVGDATKVKYKNAKDGNFYFRYTHTNDPAGLQDSCLFLAIDNNMMLEYEGSGRGPDCIKSKNDENFDNRNFVRKWFDIFTKKKLPPGWK